MRARYSRSLYQSAGNPMIVKAVQEHCVQQITFCSVGAFSSTTRCRWCAGMVSPSSATARAPFLGNPLFFSEMLEFLDELAGHQPARFERSLDGVGSLLHGSDSRMHVSLI